MSFDKSVRAFIPDTDPEYRKHKKVLLACEEAGVSLPKETAEYFGEKFPDEQLLLGKLEVKLVKGKHYKEFHKDGLNGFEIDIDKLPKSAKKIQFCYSF